MYSISDDSDSPTERLAHEILIVGGRRPQNKKRRGVYSGPPRNVRSLQVSSDESTRSARSSIGLSKGVLFPKSEVGQHNGCETDTHHLLTDEKKSGVVQSTEGFLIGTKHFQSTSTWTFQINDTSSRIRQATAGPNEGSESAKTVPSDYSQSNATGQQSTMPESTSGYQSTTVSAATAVGGEQDQTVSVEQSTIQSEETSQIADKPKEKTKNTVNDNLLSDLNGLWSNSEVSTQSQAQYVPPVVSVSQSSIHSAASDISVSSSKSDMSVVSEESLKSSGSSSSLGSKRNYGGVGKSLLNTPEEASNRTWCTRLCGNDDEIAEGDFEDGINISSDLEEKSSEGTDHEELDNEWLRLSRTQIPRVSGNVRKSQRNVSLAIERGKSKHRKVLDKPMVIPVTKPVRKFLIATRIIDLSMVYLGRFPIEVQELPDGTFKYKFSSSWRYRVYSATSLYFAVSAILMFYNIVSIATNEPVTVNERVVYLEMHKYWIEAMLEILTLFFLTVASIAILKVGGGIALVDFMNRWTSSLNILQYDVSEGIDRLLWWFFLGFGLYAAFVVGLFCFGGEEISTCRGGCGFLGLLFFNSFVDDIRIHWAYRIVEVLGLVMHLYSTLSAGLFILMITVYCRALNNGAKRFNERLLICLHGVGFRDTRHYPSVWKAIPYKKIFAEHVVITSFTKQTGRAFFFTFNGYSFAKMVAMIATLMGVGEPVLKGYIKVYNTSSLNAELDSWTVPVGFEPDHIVWGKHIVYILTTWGPWYLFMEVVLMPGITIMRGGTLILKKLYIQCKTSHALRFITSMQFSFNNKTIFYISPGMNINREFVAKFVGFTIITCLGILQFNPESTQLSDFTICNELTGECIRYQVSRKTMTKDAYSITIGKDIKDSKTPPPDDRRPLEEFVVFPVPFPPCAGNGKHPLMPEDYGYKCESNQEVYTPTYFVKNGSDVFIQVPPPAPCFKGGLNLNMSFFDGKQFYDSYGKEVTVVASDECGNAMLSTPDEYGEKTSPTLKVVRIENRLFCCFTYAHLSGMKFFGQYCTLPRPIEDHWSSRCSAKSQIDDRMTWEKKIMSLWDKTPSNVLEEQRELWTNCLCQGVGEVPVWEDACVMDGRRRTTTIPTTPKPTTPRISTTTVCGDMSATICVNCGNPITRFDEKFTTNCPIKSTSGHRLITPIAYSPQTEVFSFVNRHCEPRLEVVPEMPSDYKYFDCYGQQLEIGKKLDDCGNYPVGYPDQNNGSRITPVMRMERLPFGAFGVIRFLCCWDFSHWQHKNVHTTCNLYPDSDVEKTCSVRDAVSEAEAKAMCKGAMFRQEVNTVYKSRCLDSDEMDDTGNTVCDNPKLSVTSSPRYSGRLRLKKPFLPCPDLEMHWKTFTSVLLKDCTAKTEFKHFPYFDKDLTKIYPPSNRKNCMTKVSTRPREAFYDCYGFKYQKDELLDDCGTPGLLTPKKDLNEEAYSEPMAPTLRYVNYYRDFFLCCWKFDTQTGAKCNLAGNAISTCAFRRDVSDEHEKKNRTESDLNSLCDENEIFDENGVNRKYISRCPTSAEDGPPTVCNNPDISETINLEDQDK